MVFGGMEFEVDKNPSCRRQDYWMIRDSTIPHPHVGVANKIVIEIMASVGLLWFGLPRAEEHGYPVENSCVRRRREGGRGGGIIVCDPRCKEEGGAIHTP